MAASQQEPTELKDRLGISFTVDEGHIDRPLPDDTGRVVINVIWQPGDGEELQVEAGEQSSTFLRTFAGPLTPGKPVHDILEWAQTAPDRIGRGRV